MLSPPFKPPNIKGALNPGQKHKDVKKFAQRG